MDKINYEDTLLQPHTNLIFIFWLVIPGKIWQFETDVRILFLFREKITLSFSEPFSKEK